MPGPEVTRDLPGAVVLDAFATGLNTARALAAHGTDVVVVAMGANDVAQYSRAVSEHRRLAAPPSPESLLELLLNEAPRWRGRVLVAASDLAVETLSRFRGLLQEDYRVAVPAWPVTRRLLRKDLMRQDAEACGVATPRSYGELTRAASARRDLDYPVVVRPLRSAATAAEALPKALVVETPRALDAVADRLVAADWRAEVMELIPGGDERSYHYTALLGRD